MQQPSVLTMPETRAASVNGSRDLRRTGSHPDYWYRFVGLDGAVVGISQFGLSGPGEQVMVEVGMTVANVTAAIERVLAK